MADIISLDHHRKAPKALKIIRTSHNKTRRARISRSAILERRAVFLNEILFGSSMNRTV